MRSTDTSAVGWSTRFIYEGVSTLVALSKGKEGVPSRSSSGNADLASIDDTNIGRKHG
jgi:hypothetical protein